MKKLKISLAVLAFGLGTTAAFISNAKESKLLVPNCTSTNPAASDCLPGQQECCKTIAGTPGYPVGSIFRGELIH
ncbi:hypothetical protein D3C78_1541760 [compost metagenome]